MSDQRAVAGLTEAGCRQRQQRFGRALADAGLDGALLGDVGEIHRLCGVWDRAVFSRMLLVKADGSLVLATGGDLPAGCFVSEHVRFEANRIGTMVEDPAAGAVAELSRHLHGMERVGTDSLTAGLLDRGAQAVDVGGMLRGQRRKKSADEVDLLKVGIRGCEAAYKVARAAIAPGLSEWDLYRTVHAAALAEVGEPIGELGNDFQAGGGGGAARHRALERGETLPLDLSVVVRGYSSDLCRTFCVGEESALQCEARKRLIAALQFVETSVRPGVSCRWLYDEVRRMIEGHRDWKFTHHLGHGIGLCAHETPRLNPFWEDVFEEGDVFTAEPGLYADELRGGLRLEENYLVTADGVKRLSTFPLEA